MERELGVTYKQAHKMMKRIRTLMGDDGEPLSGDVEIDETTWGGKPRRPHGETGFSVNAQDRRAAAVAFRSPSRPCSGWSSVAGGCASASSPQGIVRRLVEP